MITTLLDDLQIPHVDTGDREVGNLKFDRDRRTFLYLISYDTGILSLGWYNGNKQMGRTIPNAW